MTGPGPGRGRNQRAAWVGVVSLALTLSGCTDDQPDADSGPTASSTSTADPTPGPGGRTDAACAGVPADYAATATSAAGSAISEEPLLSNFGVVLGQAGAVELLDAAPALTVLAPIDPALQQLPRDAYQVNLTPPRLQALIDHHLIDTRLPLAELTPGQTTRNGDRVVFIPSGDSSTIPADNTLLRQRPATICGTLETANATVYLIDQVLRPVT